jgi:hypothetical protein
MRHVYVPASTAAALPTISRPAVEVDDNHFRKGKAS